MEQLKGLISELLSRIERLETQISELQCAKPKIRVRGFSKPEEVSHSKRVWESYRIAYNSRYKVDPVRNGMVNKQVQTLVGRLGVQDAVNVVNFYVMQNERFYLQKMHPIGLCLNDAETLRSKWLTGRSITEADAKKTELGASSLSASKDYLKAKYGENALE